MTSSIVRKTAETDIKIELDTNGGKYVIDTGIGFLDHMLELFAKHGGFGLQISCIGDLRVDMHHTAEDTGICLGKVFDKALGERRGINRYGYAVIPMDETLVMTAVDFCGRGFLGYALEINTEKTGNFDNELVKEFFAAFCRESSATVHVRSIVSGNSHHVIEAAFKSFARALKQAVSANSSSPDEVPSTKGTLI